MNLQEAQLHYPLANTLPPSGSCIEVAPGVKWIRMALPFALDHINLWLLRDELDGVAGWSIVDCCIDAPESRAQWELLFERELQGLPVLRVIVTHMHPDHIGLAHWLCVRWQVSLWVSATDYLVARAACSDDTAFGGELAANFMQAHGWSDPEDIARLHQRGGYFRALVPAVPPSYRRMQDDTRLVIGGQEWRCISGFGHAPEHLALYCAGRGVLISGDMVLPRISTNVSVYPQEPEADALALFLMSIDKFRALPADTLVLPSHGKPFTGLHTRIDQLQTHHAGRLAELQTACSAAACSAFDVLPVLFKRKLDFHQTTFAMGEAIAHLHWLWFAQRVLRTLHPDGVYRFTRRADAPA